MSADGAFLSEDLRVLRELPFHAHVIKYDPHRSVDGCYDDGTWTSISDVGKSFNGELLTAEVYAAVEQAHIETLRTMAEEAAIDKLRRVDQDGGAPLSAALEEIRAALREQSTAYLWLEPDRRFYVAVGFDYHLYCGSHRPCPKGLAKAFELGLYPRLEGPSPCVMDG